VGGQAQAINYQGKGNFGGKTKGGQMSFKDSKECGTRWRET